MRFRLVPKSSTLDDLELLSRKFKFSLNFALLRMFGYYKNEDRRALSATELLRTESTFEQCIDYADIA